MSGPLSSVFVCDTDTAAWRALRLLLFQSGERRDRVSNRQNPKAEKPPEKRGAIGKWLFWSAPASTDSSGI